jgi:hypothetical protein
MGKIPIAGLIVKINSLPSKTTADRSSEAFLDEHIDIWLFTSTAINIRILRHRKHDVTVDDVDQVIIATESGPAWHVIKEILKDTRG